MLHTHSTETKTAQMIICNDPTERNGHNISWHRHRTETVLLQIMSGMTLSITKYRLSI